MHTQVELVKKTNFSDSAYTHIRIYAYTRICIYAYTHIRIYAYTPKHIHAYTYIRIYTGGDTVVCDHSCVNERRVARLGLWPKGVFSPGMYCMWLCMYMYTLMCMYMYTLMYMSAWPLATRCLSTRYVLYTCVYALCVYAYMRICVYE